MNIALNPNTNPGSRSATIAAPRTPSSATAFGPSPPRPSSTKSTEPRHSSNTHRIRGPSIRWFSLTPGASGSRNGHRKAMSPIRFTAMSTARRMRERSRYRARGSSRAPALDTATPVSGAPATSVRSTSITPAPPRPVPA